MQAYLDLVSEVLHNGNIKEDRTGNGTLSISGLSIKHNMAEGYPLLTTKRMPPKMIWAELEGFLNGITDKKWYQERGCNIWDEWCARDVVPYSTDPETQERMRVERDMGPFYGFQWRHAGAKYHGPKRKPADYAGKGVDQIERVIHLLETQPTSREMVVDAWNPVDLERMALSPCHFSWQVLVNNDKLDLVWYQRSADIMLGVPFNLASYATVLHVLAQQFGLGEGTITGHLGDAHIYRKADHLAGAEEQLRREPKPLPRIVTPQVPLLGWTHQNSRIEGYDSHPPIKMRIAV